jgi:hypothetical protein
MENNSSIASRIPSIEKSHSWNTIEKALELQLNLFTESQLLDFDIFDFGKQIGRNYVLTYLTMNLLRKLPNQPTKTLNYDENKLVSFLNEI